HRQGSKVMESGTGVQIERLPFSHCCERSVVGKTCIQQKEVFRIQCSARCIEQMAILPETRTISVQHVAFIIDDRIAVFTQPDTAGSYVAVFSARKTSIIDKRSALIHPDACLTASVVNQNRCICIQYQTQRYLSLHFYC